MAATILISGLISGTILYDTKLPQRVNIDDIKHCWGKWDIAEIETNDGQRFHLDLSFVREETDTKRPEHIQVLPYDDEGDPEWMEARDV